MREETNDHDKFDAGAVAVLEELRDTGMPDEAWKAILQEGITEMNERYFVVDLGGRSVIGSVIEDDALGRKRLVYSRPEDLRLQYGHRRLQVGVSRQGRPITKDLGTAWLEHPERRTYDRLALLPGETCPPGVFNLWRGWGVEPQAGSWPTIEQHLREVICSGNAEHLDWLLRWIASCVQHPERQAEVAVVLRGKKGIGKGHFAQLLIRIFRHHALQIANGRHLLGNFNSHLADVLMLFVDEAFFAGDKAGASVLKGLITERTLMIEPKGLNAFPMANRLKIVMASNEDWVVPASADERRFMALDVSDHRRGDQAYFNRLAAAIDGDECRAFLHDMLALDLTGWNHRQAPHTKALDDQKLQSADSVTKFWLDCLEHGEIVGCYEGGWPEKVSCQTLHQAYVKHAHDAGERYTTPSNRLRQALDRYHPHGRMRTVRPRPEPGLSSGPRRYVLARLDEHRAAFQAAMGIAEHPWCDPDEEDES